MMSHPTTAPWPYPCVQLAMLAAGPFARVAFGQGPEGAHMMAKFCLGLIPGLWPMVGVVLVVGMAHAQAAVKHTGLGGLLGSLVWLTCLGSPATPA